MHGRSRGDSSPAYTHFRFGLTMVEEQRELIAGATQSALEVARTDTDPLTIAESIFFDFEPDREWMGALEEGQPGQG